MALARRIDGVEGDDVETVEAVFARSLAAEDLLADGRQKSLNRTVSVDANEERQSTFTCTEFIWHARFKQNGRRITQPRAASTSLYDSAPGLGQEAAYNICHNGVEEHEGGVALLDRRSSLESRNVIPCTN